MKKRNWISFFASGLICASAMSGCGPGETKSLVNNWDLIATKDGVVYRINKQSGEVLLIAGNSSVIVQGTENPDSTVNSLADDSKVILNFKTHHLQDWGSIAVTDLGDVKVKLRTNWRNGKLYYDFNASPYEHMKSIIESAPSDSQFHVYLYDEDGFLSFALPIKLRDMLPLAATGTNSTGFEMNTTTICEFGSYKRLKKWAVSRIGF